MDKRQIRALEFTLHDVNDAIESGNLNLARTQLISWLWDYPDDPQALFLMAKACYDDSAYSMAIPFLEKSLRIEPISAATWTLYGLCLDVSNRSDEAIKCFSRSHNITPSPKNYVNIARAYIQLRDTKRAKGFAMRALEEVPSVDAEYIVAMAKLFDKDPSGWVGYQKGMGCPQRQVRNFCGEPVWDGSPGKNVVIYSEQGIGDEICFASAIPDAIAICKNVIIEGSSRMRALYERTFPGVRVTWRTDAPYESDIQIDASISMSGLFALFRTGGYPGTPYLKANAPQVKRLRRRYSKDRPLIGIAWTGGSPGTLRKERSVTLADFEPIYSLDATFVSLEYVGKDLSGTPVQRAREAESNDIDDVSTLVSACDLVVSVPTTAVHMAGALGVPCIVMVHERPTVFYGLTGGVDIWQSVTALRKNGPWSEVIGRAAEQTKKVIDAH